MTNTARVSALLSEIFQDEEREEEPAEELGQAENEFGGLAEKHAAFLGELISRPHWGEEEYRKLATHTCANKGVDTANRRPLPVL